MKQLLLIPLGCFALHQAQAQSPILKVDPVNFSQVQITDAFWKPKLEKVATVTIPVCIEQSEVKTRRIDNFEKVARKKGEKHEGMYYDDSDVYKALEAIAYSLKNHPDATVEKKADEWIDKIAAAQQPDGYLNTYYTLTGLDKRWTDMEKHEDYCAGHLIEAAIAYYNTTGKRKLLDVAIRFTDHIDQHFRVPNKPWVTGHQEIELALVKLYRTTHDKKYLLLADWLLQQRGHGHGVGKIWDDWKSPQYCQDDLPVRDQREIKGHAVRAMYLYTGIADVAAVNNDPSYMPAMNSIWEDVVFRNMYITGGIGSSAHNEGFSTDYDLPNESAYCETCASVGMVFWNQRMNLLTGDAKYMDVLERSLYNGALDGLSLSGNRFFYANPLASNGKYERSEWFGTACCPSNISRLIASLGDYIYAKSDDAIWVNLFVGSNTIIPLKKGKVKISQETNYPWEGGVTIHVSPERRMKNKLMVRIPGWAQDQPVPGKTYFYLASEKTPFSLTVNGQPAVYTMEHGYAAINREWKKGDVVQLNLPMEVKRVVASDSVKENKNRVSLQRGPLVYCVEHPDNHGKVNNILLTDDVQFTSTFDPGLLNGVVKVQCKAPVVKPGANGASIQMEKENITAIPYYTWANRGQGEMQVWMLRKMSNIILQ